MKMRIAYFRAAAMCLTAALLLSVCLPAVYAEETGSASESLPYTEEPAAGSSDKVESSSIAESEPAAGSAEDVPSTTAPAASSTPAPSISTASPSVASSDNAGEEQTADSSSVRGESAASEGKSTSSPTPTSGTAAAESGTADEVKEYSIPEYEGSEGEIGDTIGGANTVLIPQDDSGIQTFSLPNYDSNGLTTDKSNQITLKYLRIKGQSQVQTNVTMDLETCLVGITYTELGAIGGYSSIPAAAAAEVWKAQAIAIHSYLLYANQYGGSESNALIYTPVEQIPANTYNALRSAVSAVKYDVLVYTGNGSNYQICDAVYSCSGGYNTVTGVYGTCAGLDAWGRETPYLQGVVSPYEQKYHELLQGSIGTAKYTFCETTDTKLNKEYSSADTSQKSLGGYVKYNTLVVDGVSYSYLNQFANSRYCFDFDASAKVMNYYGRGHGVGMTQCGATGYAVEAGYKFDQILAHYYTACALYDISSGSITVLPADRTLQYDQQSGKWYCRVNGCVDYTYAGIMQHDSEWWYVRNGAADFSYNGIASNSYGTWMITNGKVNAGVNGVVQAANDKVWYYVVSGKVQTGYTGVQNNSSGWWYINKGKVDISFTGVASNQYGTWYLSKGKVDTGVNGVVQAANDKVWYYIVGGKVQTDYTGVQNNSSGWWYINKGKVDISFTGVASNQYGKWYVYKGKVDANKTGTVNGGDGKMYTVVKGKVTGTV